MKHTTVTVTDQLLINRGACGAARNSLRPLLPAKLSTRPELNLDLACAVIDTVRDNHYLQAWLDWMFNDALETYADNTRPDGVDYFRNCRGTWLDDGRDYRSDPFIIAQWLAAIADGLARKQGR